jgi:cell shape-determining protein MreC
VGRVAEVRLRPDKNFSEIIAQPASALDRDREVLLVWNAGDDVPRASEAAAASEQAADDDSADPG